MTTTPIRSLAIDEALAFAERAEAAADAINRLHASRRTEGPAIAQQHQEMGLCLKLADVHATLAVADQLQALREELRDAMGTR